MEQSRTQFHSQTFTLHLGSVGLDGNEIKNMQSIFFGRIASCAQGAGRSKFSFRYHSINFGI